MQLNSNDLISLKELTDLLHVSRQTVYNWLAAGTAPRNERIGGRYLFCREDALKRVKKDNP